ncbi:GntR family transcriptional regulator [Neobacillus mesonae]|uniref:GntR family transcriptional regulator n=1 Tax=Neobacillus mesonae TaxID=1193713 RepID=UPI00203AAE03|nr:GntR family transcriptional regulator [Neobacillus mesonae]MCM3570565.1 GntR family transcriptional regulator [Neobacillus mesonae]
MGTLAGFDKNIPLYIQVKDILIRRIQDKVWAPNALIPTEQELMKEFSVSRTTIRQSISILVKDGLLEKKQGKGTIVRPRQLTGSLGILKGFAEEVAESGLVPESKLLSAEFSRGFLNEKSYLKLQEDDQILVVKRIRFANKLPVALEQTCWPAFIGKILIDEDLEAAKFYEVLERNKIVLREANEKISAVNASIEEADLLGIRGGEALIKMERLSFDSNHQPIEFTTTKFCNDKYHYTIELTR